MSSAAGPSSASSTTSTSTLPPTSTQPQRTTKATHPNLPPGLILDADGKPCKVCNSWQDWAKMKVVKKGEEGGVGSKKATGVGNGMGGFAALMSGAAAAASSSSSASSSKVPSIPTPDSDSSTTGALSPAVPDRSDCPPDTALLGRSTWTFLHTTAAYYPLRASPLHQTNMHSLLSSLGILYPCGWCAEDFQRDMKANPPDLSGREGLSRWLCERHNEVNDKLGKETFECTWEKLGERWKDGPADGRCD